MTEILNDATVMHVKTRHVVPPRERILNTAREMFHQYGIHAVGVDAIAAAAQTNKMTLYRHFSSKDELIAATIDELRKDSEVFWQALLQTHEDDPRSRFNTWLEMMYTLIRHNDHSDCQLMNKSIEIQDVHHPARLALEEMKRSYIDRISTLCRAVGLVDSEVLATKLYVVFEGARVSQHIGSQCLAAIIPQMVQTLIATHQQA